MNTIYLFDCFLFRFTYWKIGWKTMRRICTSHQLEHHTEVSTQFPSLRSFSFVWKICFGLDNLLKTLVSLKHLYNVFMTSYRCFVCYNRAGVWFQMRKSHSILFDVRFCVIQLNELYIGVLKLSVSPGEVV